MKNRSRTGGFGVKKIIGLCLIIFSVLVFVLCCFPKFLSLGNFFLGVFGVMAYPLCLLLALIGAACLMNLSYTFSVRFTVYMALALFSLLGLFHTIFTSKLLSTQYTTFKNMGAYLKACYSMSGGITVGGLIMGIPVFFVRALLKLGGTYVLFAILSTVFVGLIVDYAIYRRGKKNGKPVTISKEESRRRLEDNKLLDGDDNSYSFTSKNIDERSHTFEELEQPEEPEDTTAEIFETTFNEDSENDLTDMGYSFSTPSSGQPATSLFTDPNAEGGKDYAKNLLFGDTNHEEEKVDSASEPRSAHDILFGNEPAVPNIFDRSSEDRDAWKRQYASKPLTFNDEPEETQPAEEEHTVSENGAIKTSWGEYRPTGSFTQPKPAEEKPPVMPDRVPGSLSDRLSDRMPDRMGDRAAGRLGERVGRNAEQTSSDLGIYSSQPAEDKPLDTSRIRERNGVNIERERTSLSNFSRLSPEGEQTTEFASRLDRRSGGDILANASSLGIEAKEPSNFSAVLPERSERIRQPREEVKPEPQQSNLASQVSQKYNPPPTSLLNVIKEEHVDYSEEYKKKSAILEKTLNDFKISAKVINVVRGPKVTRYELTMPSGIPVSRVLAYDKDMSMNLATRSGVRIEAPIPGKNAFGVEVENDKASTVGLRELVESPEFKNFKGPLPVAIGKNISGEVIIKSLPKMVHLLIAGSTGSGKSVFLHSLIMSLMYKHSPDELRFIMIDPKRVEFSRYNKMPHMMLPEIVSDCTKAVNALNWAVKEMERRYQLLMDNECQKLEQFNECAAVKEGREKKLPYLVIVVDELAELMGVAKKEVEGKIQRITQLGRAAGIHMVVATQRPSTDVVTGTIKNNLPTRVAFSLSSAIDSMTVINTGGAEKLLGQGDMLLSAQDSNQLVRLQAAFVSDEEIRATLNYIKANNVSVYDEEIQKSIYAEPEEESLSDDGDDGNGSNDDRMDEYMPQALKLVMKNGKASISMIQRRFSVGYARAARIIDQMETHGFIDGGIGNKPRDVKITIEEYNQLFGNYDAE